MNILPSNKDKFAEYCVLHSDEFRYELRDEASKALNGWPCRIAAILLTLSSFATYYHPANSGNPFIQYTLFTYSIPILLVITYPIAILLLSSIEKFSPIVLDFLILSGLLGFIATLSVLLLGSITEEEVRSVYLGLSGQIHFVLLLATAFSYHNKYSTTLIRNVLFGIVLAVSLGYLNADYIQSNFIQILQGFLVGTIFSWIFFISIRTRFYLKSTDADTRQHLYDQLSKLVYAHQLERIKLGDQLENTMPQKEGKAIVNVFDVQKSSEIKHENTKEFFMSVFQSFLQICMEGYEHNPLRSRAFRLKETGDGFISTVGYPFLPIESRSLADSAVSTALEMFHLFNAEVEKFNYSRPIKGAMGLAYNSVQGTFQSGGIRAYDLFGDALIQAARYEEIRKNPVVAGAIKKHAKEIGLEYFHIIIVQEVIYNSLSDEYRNLFVEINVETDYFREQNFQLLYDTSAKYIYFHIRE